MTGVLLLTLSILTVVRSFVLDTGNSSALTPHDFRQLVDLLVEEKHLRSQLETQVSQLVQEVHNNEGRLDAFNQAFNKERSNRHQLELSYTQLSIEFHNLSIEHQALMARNKELEKGFLNLTRVSQDRLHSMDMNISDMNRSTVEYLHNETAHIQAIHQAVSSHFIAVESNISSLTNDVFHHQQQLATIESDNKAIHLSVSTNQAEVSANRAEIRKNRANITSALARIATNQAELSATRADITKNRANITSASTRISANQANIATVQADVSRNHADLVAKGRTISTNHADISSLKLKAGYQIGFSASGHTVVSGILKFDSVKTNYGNRYSTSTGKFTCSSAGLYFFSLSLIKARADHSVADIAYCYIKKNSAILIGTHTDPHDDDTDNGSYETSAFIVTHLNYGDTVYVGSCTSSSSLDSYSSFTGVLLRAD